MIEQIKDGDHVVFLPNILKDGTYGDKIIDIERFFIKTSDGVNLHITDDPKLEIFPELKKIYWEWMATNNNFKHRLTRSVKYYSYVLLNGEYKIISFGRTIYNKISEYLKEYDEINVIFIINIKLCSGFLNYDNCFFSDIPIPNISEEFLKTKSMYIEDISTYNIWTDKKNQDNLFIFLKESGVDISNITVLKNKQREEKLKRILND